MNLNYEDFKALNPKFKGEVAPVKDGSTIALRIPPGMNEIALQAANDSVVDKVQFVADTGDTQTYRIRSGDSLYTIARRYRTTVAYLRDLNDISRGKLLRIGMRIQVPDRTPVKNRRGTAVASHSKKSSKAPANAGSVVQEAGGRVYIVQSGDSLYTIAQKYSTSVAQLQKLNNLRRGRLLKIGVKIRLPDSDADKDEAKNKSSVDSGSARKVASVRKVAKKKARVRVHVVKRGENLDKIAHKYKVSTSDIQEKNKIKNPSKVMVGARLLIPLAVAEE
jgi:membrane-bound lytic murein transglycosylase D